ncbi:DUF6011 domain-containing protein [Mycolicibacter minnesotensis]
MVVNKVLINDGKGAGPTRAGIPTDLPDWRVAVRCTVCGRWISDPTSVQLGVGPTCRGRSG